jgi:hypothetical protein
MTPVVYIVHQMPGRVRFRAPAKRGDPSFFDAVETGLRKCPMVDALSTNARSGSVLVHHQGDLGAVTAFAAEKDLFKLGGEVGGASPAPRASPASDGALEADPLSLLAAGFAGLSLYQLARGGNLGSAVENFWNGYTARRTLNDQWISLVLLVAGAYQLANGQLLGSAASLMFYAATARHLAKLDQDKSSH